MEGDLTKPYTITALKERLVKDHGGIDILVNNAGIAFKVLYDYLIPNLV